jgi:hypothetical protein
VKIGDLVIVVKDFEFNNRYYKVGDVFKIVSDSGQRGWDIQDSSGNIIYESVMLSVENYKSLKSMRDERINSILGDDNK